MIREVLSLLSGHHNGLLEFVNCEFRVVQNLKHLHPAVIEKVTQLGRLGLAYKSLNSFVESNVKYNSELYMAGTALGVKKVLQEYMIKISSLDIEVLEDSNIALSHLSNELQPYFPLFKQLEDVVEQINRSPRKGCHLLDIVYEHIVPHTTRATDPLQDMIWECHYIMFKQLKEWLLFGSIVDRHNEFFIQREDNGDDYVVRADLLPSYISVRTARKILFIGNALQLSKRHSSDLSLSACLEYAKMTSQFDTNNLEENDVESKSPLLTRIEWQQVISEKLNKLQKQSKFSSNDLEKLINEVRQFAAEQLWQTIVEDGNLAEQLKTMKDLYFLGKGDLFNTFIQKASCIRMTGSRSIQTDLRTIFQVSGHEVGISDDLLDKCSLSVSSDYKVWENLELDVAINADVQAFFTPDIIHSYKRIFHFLIRLKKLHWLLHSSRSHLGSLWKEGKHDPRVWHVQHNLYHFLSSFLGYLYEDVIELNMSRLMMKVRTVRDYEAVLDAHNLAITNIMEQSFILNERVFLSLKDFSNICETFCDQVVSDSLTPSTLKEVQDQLGTLLILFDQKLNAMLFTRNQSHLCMLLMRLNASNSLREQAEMLE